mgnify:CR=1 FL=1
MTDAYRQSPLFPVSTMPSEFVRQEDLDQMIQATTLDEVFEFYGQPYPAKRSGNNLRMACPIDDCEPSSYGQLSISNLPPYFIKCHTCGIRGHIMTLMWITKHNTPTSGGGVPKGDEYREVLEDLQTIRSGAGVSAPAIRRTEVSNQEIASEKEPVLRNIPLARSDNERARELVNLPEQFVTDVAKMPPAASRYFRQRPYLTPDVCRKWNVGYLPSSAKGTMRGRITYGIESESGELLGFVGRDPDYEAKRGKWNKDKSGAEPIKHRFPSGRFLRRGLELYGQQSRRLDELGCRDRIAQIGILVVEGMNDVIRLDADGVPAVALMSNEVSDEQITKIVRWARGIARGKISLMLDNDDRGRDGAKATLWKLAQQTSVTVANYQADQPEHLSCAELEAALQSLSEHWN